jgi:CO/xanthine dehydrogenase Mo-binding subunit/aerobic-type carbon monoxide dehydrogenase small subunit (CoxS/CutS family)
MADTFRIALTVNGKDHAADVLPTLTLLDFLRDGLKLKGAKECCAVGECGACTVMVDGETVNACLVLAVEADGTRIRTVEGLAPPGDLSPLQAAFLDCGAVQCGFCIPGMVMSAQQILDEHPHPDEAVVREGLSGNLCRCGGYNRMFAAMRQAGGAASPDHGAHAPLAGGETARLGGAGSPALGAGANAPMVGRDIVRFGGAERVNGTQAFLADIDVENVLHLKLVTLDVAVARIDGIDLTEARAVPGVVDIVTAADLPQPVPRFGPVYRDRPVIAVGQTSYHGEPVAVVAAETKEAAELAASLVRVAHTVLPSVTTVAEAVAPGAPLVQAPGLRSGDPLAGTNILKTRRFGWGDVDAASADLVIEERYTFPMVTHFAIEPHGFIVDARPDRMTIWSPVQHPYLLQKIMAELFDLPLTRVQVLAPDPGGGFGGKQNPKYEPLLAHVSLRTGRPCRLVLTLEETFQAVRRAASDITVRSGFTTAGDVVFHDITSDYLIGAYADIAERVMTKGNYLACGPYRVPNARINARAILSNTTPSTAFRGFGTPQVAWAVESQMDAAARALGIDGLAIRLRNLAGRGDEVVKGDFPADGDWPQSVKLAAEALGWDTPLPPGHGRGIAVAIKAGATTGLSNATVRLLADGSVIVYAGTSDMGQGARTIFAQLAADALGVPLDRITVVMGDTSVVPFDLQTSASRSTVFMGTAITRACADICEQVVELAVDLLGVDPSEVRVEAGMIHLPDGVQTIHSFVRTGLGRWNGELIGNGRMRKPTMKDHALGGTPAFYEFNCTAFEVSVDEVTGEILIHKHVVVGDVGRALNPLQVEMQDEGAAIMGLGHSMMEQIIFGRNGTIRNLGALDYRIPTTKDMPIRMDARMVENGDGPGPHGAKGVSEGAILCTAPALAAAVTAATGAVIRDLPLTPERVWFALNGATAAE